MVERVRMIIIISDSSSIPHLVPPSTLSHNVELYRKNYQGRVWSSEGATVLPNS